MDSRAERAARAQRIRDAVTTLEVDGGDELVVIEEDINGWLKGLRAYGPLDLAADPRDLVQELGDEERDARNYLAALRAKRRRAGVSPGPAEPTRCAGCGCPVTHEPRRAEPVSFEPATDEPGAFDHLTEGEPER